MPLDDELARGVAKKELENEGKTKQKYKRR